MSYFIVGLGNPGKRFEKTRHNLGFMVIDRLRQKWGAQAPYQKFEADIAEGKFQSHEKVFLVKPQTFMNLSGQAVGGLISFYKAEPKNALLVVVDDLDLPVGKLRIRKKGGSGGHNGMRSIIDAVGEEFCRLRIGIGRPAERGADFVLSKAKPQEQVILDEAIQKATEAIELALQKNIDTAMNQFNSQGEEDDGT